MRKTRLMSRQNAATMALLALCSAPVPALAQPTVSAQPTSALIEDWRNADFGFASRMMASDPNGSLYVVGDTTLGDYLVVKKLSAAGVLVWQATYDPAERLRGVWIAIDSAAILSCWPR